MLTINRVGRCLTLLSALGLLLGACSSISAPNGKDATDHARDQMHKKIPDSMSPVSPLGGGDAPAPLHDLVLSAHSGVSAALDLSGAGAANPVVRLGDIHGVHELPSSYWTVQVASVRNIQRIAELVHLHGLHGSGVLGVPIRTKAGDMHAVLLGVYRTRQAAEDHAQVLPEPFAGLKPWVRPLGQLQASMR